MKKGTKITLITIASVVGAAALLSCTVGGIPCKAFAEKNYEMIYETSTEYPYPDAQTPDDWETYSMLGLSMQAPAGLKPKGETGMKSRFFVSDTDDDYWQVCFMIPDDMGEFKFEYDSVGTKSALIGKTAERMLRNYAKRQGNTLDDWYSYYDLMYSVSIDDCSKHSLRKGLEFDLVGYLKEISANFFAGAWDWHTDQGDGFILQVGTPESMQGENHWHWMVMLYPKENRNYQYWAMIGAPDYESAAKIVNSIRLTNQA